VEEEHLRREGQVVHEETRSEERVTPVRIAQMPSSFRREEESVEGVWGRTLHRHHLRLRLPLYECLRKRKRKKRKLKTEEKGVYEGRCST
jgi:hypothetical protein